jgi:hypothetical protein
MSFALGALRLLDQAKSFRSEAGNENVHPELEARGFEFKK